MPSSPSQLSGTPTPMAGPPGSPAPMAGPPPAVGPGYSPPQQPTPYRQYGPPPASERQAPTSMPVGLILLSVLEGLVVLSSLYGLLTALVGSGAAAQSQFRQSMPALVSNASGGVVNLIPLCLASYALYGFIRRLAAARVVAMVQAVLNGLLGLALVGIGFLAASVGATAMQSSSAGVPHAGAQTAAGIIGFVFIAIGGVFVVFSGVIIWYLCKENVREWLSY